jgi:hypothetical protein
VECCGHRELGFEGSHQLGPELGRKTGVSVRNNHVREPMEAHIVLGEQLCKPLRGQALLHHRHPMSSLCQAVDEHDYCVIVSFGRR